MTIPKQQHFIDKELDFGPDNYKPIPVVLSKAKGVWVWDVDNNKYLDMMSAYSAVSHGHSHPELLKVLHEQSSRLALTSRAFYNDVLGSYEKYVTEYFNFDKVLPMNTGAEAVETALKLCRKWAYEVKGIEENKAEIIVCENNFHGRTTTIISFSNDPVARKNFGPFTNGFIKIEYDNLLALREALENNKNVAGFLVEPIQGEAGVYVPSEGYLSSARALCEEFGVLFIADEVQTGIARTGRLLATCGNCSCEDKNCSKNPDVKPDILILGKALSGGVFPVSAALADNEIMMTIKPGEHGSTFGGNPLGCKVAMAALQDAVDENLAENAEKLGKIFRSKLTEFSFKSNLVRTVRGKGLLNAIIINDNEKSDTAWYICLKLRDNGLLAKPTHGNIIRFAPPLVMNETQLLDCVDIIIKTLKDFEES